MPGSTLPRSFSHRCSFLLAWHSQRKARGNTRQMVPRRAWIAMMTNPTFLSSRFSTQPMVSLVMKTLPWVLPVVSPVMDRVQGMQINQGRTHRGSDSDPSGFRQQQSGPRRAWDAIRIRHAVFGTAAAISKKMLSVPTAIDLMYSATVYSTTLSRQISASIATKYNRLSSIYPRDIPLRRVRRRAAIAITHTAAARRRI